MILCNPCERVATHRLRTAVVMVSQTTTPELEMQGILTSPIEGITRAEHETPHLKSRVHRVDHKQQDKKEIRTRKVQESTHRQIYEPSFPSMPSLGSRKFKCGVCRALSWHSRNPKKETRGIKNILDPSTLPALQQHKPQGSGPQTRGQRAFKAQGKQSLASM